MILDAEYLRERGEMTNAVKRAETWMRFMAAYQGAEQSWPLKGEVERERERYVLGEITLEAFEARLDIAFGIQR